MDSGSARYRTVLLEKRSHRELVAVNERTKNAVLVYLRLTVIEVNTFLNIICI